MGAKTFGQDLRGINHFEFYSIFINKLSNIYLFFLFRSASAKSKYAIDWYFAGKKDELTNCKSTLKLNEDSEPIALLVDPKDSKSVFALCINRFHFDIFFVF